uniref:Reverse transcriptase zinc-binding domain-containing protein n=1 Tax=Arundo donax TaxID=35708 RepID=A0A0A9ASZ9_ARUDO
MGAKTKFWHDRWIQGQAPKEIAATLFKLAWRKNLMVGNSLTGRKWMRGLRRISTDTECREFIALWTLLHEFQLTDQPDKISWRFSAGGNYSAQSAYRFQFKGTYPDHEWHQI